jgi:hypothetical protein
MFLSDLCVRDSVVEDEWVVERPLIWFSPRFGRIVVPAEFITDLASVPKPLRPFLNTTGRSRKCGVLHDYVYCDNDLTREDADQLLYDALVAEGVTPAVARIYWAGVRAGGWLYYNKRKEGLDLAYDFTPAGAAELTAHVA